MAQERMNDWMEYVRELARAERELRIERWVFISIEYKDEAGNPVRLHSYNLPRDLHERHRWVIRWREARLQCLYPKKQVNTYYSYYDKRTGLRTDFNSCLSKLSAAKAQISIAERKEREYVQYQRANNLFFDEGTDEQLVRFHEKLRMKKEKYMALEHEIRSAMRSASEYFTNHDISDNGTNYAEEIKMKKSKRFLI
ncbi:hypothetical protein [Phocaeicola vulgatus]|uniref:hypothetical protein n=1 Tax=Phocaeicola vulgatus TaxID=821 RepID=UPI002307145D|nr:hypothetical protein [Phocaeicola vulgatus]